MECSSRALQLASRKVMIVLWQRLAGTDYFCTPKEGWFTC